MRVKLIAACVGLAGCLIAAPGASAAPPANDVYTAPTTLPLETQLTANNTEATVAPTNDEPLTPPSGLACPGTPPTQMTHTVWFLVTPSANGPFSVHTLFSTTNTIIAVYNTDGTGTPGNPPPDADGGDTNMLGCNDDAGSFSTGSRVTFAGQAGFGFLVQVGTRDGYGPEQLKIFASAPPANDTRAAAAALSGGSALRDNLGATEEGGEDLDCGGVQLGSTVWFKYEVTAPGTLSFITSNGQLDSVLQLYRGNETQPLTCNDDIQGQPIGPSFVSATVTPGTYFLQVGGALGEQDDVTLNTTFTENLDVDGDGSDRPADCDDDNASVHPGATDVPGNGIDEDCSGADATPAGPPPSPPDTTITKAKVNAKHSKASFEFEALGEATGFQCELKRKHAQTQPRFTDCNSPKTYKPLKPGKYTFAARAVGPGGTDTSPARKRFRIPRRR